MYEHVGRHVGGPVCRHAWDMCVDMHVGMHADMCRYAFVVATAPWGLWVSSCRPRARGHETVGHAVIADGATGPGLWTVGAVCHMGPVSHGGYLYRAPFVEADDAVDVQKHCWLALPLGHHLWRHGMQPHGLQPHGLQRTTHDNHFGITAVRSPSDNPSTSLR